jgi:hypothetical protein
MTFTPTLSLLEKWDRYYSIINPLPFGEVGSLLLPYFNPLPFGEGGSLLLPYFNPLPLGEGGPLLLP